MKWFSSNTPIVLFAVVALVLLGNAALGYLNTRHLDDDAGWVTHTHEVLEATESLLGTLRDGETGTRGYLLTNDLNYLEPYKNATLAYANDLEKVRSLTDDNPHQQERIPRLNALVAERMALLDQTVSQFRQGEQEAARQSIKSGEGHRLMNDIRVLVAEMEDEERRLLSQREKTRLQAYNTSVRSNAITLVVGLLAVASAAWFARRSIRERGRADTASRQKALIQSIVAGMGDGVIVSDPEGRVTMLNRVAQSLTGWTEAEAAGEPLERVFNVVNIDSRKPVANPAKRALIEGRVVLLEANSALIAKDGTEWPVDDSAAPITDADGNLVGAVLVFREVSERHRTERAVAEATRRQDELLVAVRESEAKFRSVVDGLAEGVLLVEVSSKRVVEANGTLLKLTGYYANEIATLNLFDVLTLDRTSTESGLKLAEEQKQHKLGRNQLRRKDGTMVDAEVSVSLVAGSGPGLMAVVVRDVSEQRVYEDRLFEYQMELEGANAKLQLLAVTDGLTGVRNRAAFNERMGEECERSNRYGHPLSVILLDVDYFKQFNDTFGHPAGDEVLKTVARTLRETARSSDVVARYGGEEFALILPDTDYAGAMVVAERCRRAVASHPWSERAVTVSGGVATTATAADDPAALVEMADRALYRSKQAGRNRIFHGNPPAGTGSEMGRMVHPSRTPSPTRPH